MSLWPHVPRQLTRAALRARAALTTADTQRLKRWLRCALGSVALSTIKYKTHKNYVLYKLTRQAFKSPGYSIPVYVFVRDVRSNVLSQRQIYLTSAHERRGMVHGPCLVCSLCVVPVPRSRRFYLSRAARMPLAVPLPASRLPCVHAGVCLGNCNNTAAWAGNCDHDCDQVGHRWVITLGSSGGGLACGRD